jgi:hypothetical protein
MPWMQLIAIGPLAAAGCWAGWRAGRARWWGWVFAGALAVVLLVAAGHRSPRLSVLPPVAWAVDVDVEPLVMAAAVPLLLVPLLARSPRRQRPFVGVVAGIMLAYYAVLPPLCPLVARGALAAGRTHVDKSGVCVQSTPYTCGPASAVTCLRALGVPAEEGRVAIAARCGPMVGTAAAALAAAVRREFGPAGVAAECRYVPTLAELPTPAVAEVIDPQWGGHFVAVLEAGPDFVIVGDPFGGRRQRLAAAEFLGRWKHLAVVMSRTTPRPPGR